MIISNPQEAVHFPIFHSAWKLWTWKQSWVHFQLKRTELSEEQLVQLLQNPPPMHFHHLPCKSKDKNDVNQKLFYARLVSFSATKFLEENQKNPDWEIYTPFIIIYHFFEFQVLGGGDGFHWEILRANFNKFPISWIWSYWKGYMGRNNDSFLQISTSKYQYKNT